MLIDSFLAFNEIELAYFRIRYLWEITDKVIIGESRLTHSGVEKPLYFSDWLRTRPDLQTKVEIIEINLDKNQGNWNREIASREYIQNFLKENFNGSRAILSDLDEIPTKQQVLDFTKVSHNSHFAMKTYYRKANFALRDSNHRTWNHGVMIYDHSSLPRNGGRYSNLPLLESGQIGGHFSYLGMSEELVRTKLKSFAHSELETSHLGGTNFIEFCDLYGVDHLGRFQENGMGIFKVLRRGEFSDLLREMYDYKQSWFSLDGNPKPFFLRVLASANVTHATKNIIGSKSSREAINGNLRSLKWIYKANLGIALQISRKLLRILMSNIAKFKGNLQFERSD